MKVKVENGIFMGGELFIRSGSLHPDNPCDGCAFDSRVCNKLCRTMECECFAHIGKMPTELEVTSVFDENVKESPGLVKFTFKRLGYDCEVITPSEDYATTR